MAVPPASVAAWQLAAAAAMMTPLALALEQPWLAPLPSASAWAAIVLLAVVCSSFAYIIYFRLIDGAGATNALLVTLLVPPVAIVLSALFLDERLAPQHFGGLALIAAGLAAIDGRLLRRARTAFA